ncbi:uncharacterized protein IL334_004459 [Kwoniella shivajii]|uniref:Uncharacterized protein n=1 Tax=Kwoniella shivajii TaxID=564305 RepID=A0ABZ1D1M4_9TREE|nr:hypothetical protein IL334_004459 [Kwoniella shivajii]
MVKFGIDQKCACQYPDASSYELCVLLLARTYQAHILQVFIDCSMQEIEITYMTFPQTMKSKMPLYALPMLPPEPKIIFKPFPSIGKLKNWMHGYDLYLKGLVEESERVEKRLDKLRWKKESLDGKSTLVKEKVDTDDHLGKGKEDKTIVQNDYVCHHVKTRDQFSFLDHLDNLHCHPLYRPCHTFRDSIEMIEAMKEYNGTHTSLGLRKAPSSVTDKPIRKVKFGDDLSTKFSGQYDKAGPSNLSHEEKEKAHKAVWASRRSEERKDTVTVLRKRKLVKG